MNRTSRFEIHFIDGEVLETDDIESFSFDDDIQYFRIEEKGKEYPLIVNKAQVKWIREIEGGSFYIIQDMGNGSYSKVYIK
jgi:hypothetical protein